MHLHIYKACAQIFAKHLMTLQAQNKAFFEKYFFYLFSKFLKYFLELFLGFKILDQKFLNGSLYALFQHLNINQGTYI